MKSLWGSSKRRRDAGVLSWCSALFVVLWAPVIGSSTSSPTARQSAATEFYLLFREYRSGDADAAVKAFAAWSPERVQREARLMTGQDDGWSQGALALLHLEVRWSLYEPAWFGDAGVATHLIGQAYGAAQTTGDARLQRFCRDWYRVALTSIMGITGNPDTLVRAARKIMPDDPQIALGRGTFEEFWMQFVAADASGYWKAGGESQGGGAPGAMPQPDLSSSHGEFFRASTSDAQAAFREALRLDPHLVEARVRLGRVLLLLDHREDAERELRHAQDEGTRDPSMGYLASLFLGQLYEETRRVDAARDAYEAALRFVPRGQTARIALARLLLITGHESDAWDTAAASLVPYRPGTTPEPDPWILYPEGRVSFERDARLHALRAQIRLR